MNTTVTMLRQDPIDAVVEAGDDAVLAVIAGVEGPSYRPVGATMAILGPHHRVGTLSSGCVESDIALHALAARDAGEPRLIRYGRGSPYVDIQLPCGGGLDILLVPSPDRKVLTVLNERRARRVACALQIDLDTGAMAITPPRETGRSGQTLSVRFDPDIRFLIFGKGPEASTFAGLVRSAGYPNLLLSPDPETLAHGEEEGCDTFHLVNQKFPAEVTADARTAVVLFFHDHDWEPPILKDALDTPAFYIGAQGSMRAREARLLMLEGMGVSHDQLARLHGPVGLIPSARDAGTLAVSVLAEVLGRAMEVSSR